MNTPLKLTSSSVPCKAICHPLSGQIEVKQGDNYLKCTDIFLNDRYKGQTFEAYWNAMQKRVEIVFPFGLIYISYLRKEGAS